MQILLPQPIISSPRAIDRNVCKAARHILADSNSTAAKKGLDALPTELVDQIARSLPQLRDVNALAKVNQRFFAILDPVLYRLLSSHALEWATRKDSVETAKKALQYGAQPNAVEMGRDCPLRYAVAQGRLPIVRLLLDHGATIRDPMILGTAAFRGFDEIAELLLDHGASPNVRCEDKTPLQYAAQKGNESTFTLLLQRGTDIFAHDATGLSTLFYAVDGGCIGILAKLLDLGFGKYQSLGDSGVAQVHAARLGRLDAVKLFNKRGVDVNLADRIGRTALYWAAVKDYFEMVQYLLKQGASLETRDDWGDTPALHAAIKGNTCIVEILLDHGADLEDADGNGRTMLSWAAGQGHEDTTRLLLDRGASIETMDKEWRTPLLLAAHANHVTTVKVLIDAGANVNCTDGKSSPLSFAAGHGNSQMVRLLLKARASTEFTTPKEQTPLFLAVMSKGASAVDTVHALLDNGANTEATDKHGKTALHYAVSRENAFLSLFVSSGANFDARDSFGKNLLMYASIAGQSDYIHELIKRGLKVNDQDADGETALHHAVMARAVDSMLPLLQNGADPGIRNHEGYSVYELARVTGSDDLLMEAERELESKRV
ncbi:hypothetical protein ACHAPX_002101 [Trichoderma viride]